MQQEIPEAPPAINRLGVLGIPAKAPTPQAISIATLGRQPSSSGREKPDGFDLFKQANKILDEILTSIITDYNNFNLKRLETAYRQLLTAPKEFEDY